MRRIPKALGLALPLLVTVALASCTPPTTATGAPTTTTAPPTGVLQVSAGRNHACALLAGGTVTCWGENFYGQLGNATNTGNTADDSTSANPTPTAVAGLTGVTQIAAGAWHTCALLATGIVTCWGSNLYGQLGNATNAGTTNPNATRTAVLGLTGVTQIAAGTIHTCALLAGGTVTCWGFNGYGQLGNTTNNGAANTNANPTPTAVAGLSGVTQIDGGFYHTCGLLTAGTVTCWGSNLYGQLGNAANNGTNNPNPSPATVAGLSGVTQLSPGDFHTCALLSGGTVTCWGYNRYGQLGNTTNNGTETANPTPTVVAGLVGVTQIAAGGYHSCALLAGGIGTCWGYNRYGQLGNAASNGTNVANSTPTVVAGLTGVTQIAAGFFYTCAPLAVGIVTCWGYNRQGQLGNAANNGTETANPSPAAVVGIP
jgi:alpha-tubulin suppressor-like RCC1 family protein